MRPGSAVAGEDKWHGGFMNDDFSPKPAYHVLNNLINKEWKTKFSGTISSENKISFRGFYGDYIVRIKRNGKVTEQKITFSKNGARSITIK